ncbi:MAG: alkaline phosphatase family protein, partial [Sphaerochaetaceae bacterium]|nr:alkaline phosphatase family protein [Sphaerochaetaceae bacterium]
MSFEVKNNYDECLTNLACSVRRYFGLEYKHRSLSYIDELLDKYQPKNVVTILLDGMGSNILDRVLDKKSFFIKNRVKAISSVFPATTVAATTAMTTGLNPVESGMLGWDMYYKGLDRTITTFLSIEKGSSEVLAEAVAYKDAHMKTESIVDQINRAGLYQGFSLFPFGVEPYKDFDDMLAIIRARCAQDGRKYIYAYDTEPDSSMHKFGCYCEQAKKLIFERNDKI